MLSRRAVFALSYVSGIAGLIDQALWLRRLTDFRRISLLYAINTFGAMTGTLLSGLILIPVRSITARWIACANTR